jgi:archaetidylinositol phosphate synthase
MTRSLIGTRINPNHLTATRIATALAASLLLAAGDRNWSVIAGGIFLVSFLLDRADGELARQTGTSSAWGHRFDLFSDYFANIAVFLGMGFGLRDGPLGGATVALGILAGVAIVSIFALVNRIERIEGPGAAAFPTAAGFDPDDAMIVAPIAVLFGGEMYVLVAAAIGAPLFFLWTCWRFRIYLGQLHSGTERRG